VDGDRVLRPPSRGAMSLRGHLSPTGQPSLRWLPVESSSPMCRPPLVATYGVAEPDVPAPAPVSGCGVTAPDSAARASASINSASFNASPARRAESWKSSIITRCCSCVGWVTGRAPDSCVPPISSEVPPNKSGNGNSSGGVSPL
jgi:hypothetical protein